METVIKTIWSRSKVLIKAGIIGILILLLMIPAAYVSNLIEEREARQKEAIAEVSQKWAGKQTVTGPILVVPYMASNTDVNSKVTSIKRFVYFLPEVLLIHSQITPKEKHRGIYKVMLYNTHVQMKGSFGKLNLSQVNIEPQQILWDEVFIRMNISDTRGLNDELQLRWNDTTITFTPNALGELDGEGGLTAKLPAASLVTLSEVSFESNINISGSQQLLFSPIGKTTKVQVQSTYPHPSFTGEVLPQQTTISDSGFSATWISLAYKRNFPQQFRQHETSTGRSYDVEATAFGLDLFVPVNAYQKTLRSVKYSILCIALTFAAFFLIETIHKKSVHPFQYGLIGMALILFYTLLLSFSEYIGFNPAYAVASLCTIGLIAWFVKGILQSSKLTIILSVVLVMVYSYVFSILQLQDYSLLLGSVGLFVTLAVIMYFSRRLQW